MGTVIEGGKLSPLARDQDLSRSNLDCDPP